MNHYTANTPHMRQNSQTGESGAVIVFIAIALFALVACVVLVVDASLLWNSSQEQDRYTRAAALSGLQGYFSAGCASGQPQDSVCQDARLARALDRVNGLSSKNPLLSDPSHLPVASLTSQAGKGLLQQGKWNETNNTFTPLYSGENIPNAVRVSGQFFKPLPTILAKRLFGTQSIQQTVDAVAYYPPKRVVFVVDFSRSLVRDNYNLNTFHNPATPNSKDLYQAAYVYSCDSSGSQPPAPFNEAASYTAMGVTQHNRPTSPPPTNPNDHYYLDYFYTYDYLYYDTNYQYAGANSNIRKYHPDPSVNSKYSCPNQRYKFDAYRDGSIYTGPEPLTSVLNGINHGMVVLRDRNHPWDQASFVGGDNKLEWPRVVNMTDKFNYLVSYTTIAKDTRGNYPHGNSMANASALATATGARYHLFPKITLDSCATPTKSLNGSNLKMMLQEAVAQLGNSPKPGRDSIVLFTDGFTNCPTDSFSGVPKCDVSFDAIRAAWEELDEYVTTTIVPLGIPVHVIAVGNNLKPNTVGIKEGPGSNRCISDAQAREQGKTFVYVKDDVYQEQLGETITDWDNWYVAKANHPTPPIDYEINRYLYNIAYRTRGIFGPVRPRAQSCQAVTSQPIADAQCGDLPDYNASNVAGTTKVIEVDPYCRSPQGQIEAYIDEIIGDKEVRITQ